MASDPRLDHWPRSRVRSPYAFQMGADGSPSPVERTLRSVASSDRVGAVIMFVSPCMRAHAWQLVLRTELTERIVFMIEPMPRGDIACAAAVAAQMHAGDEKPRPLLLVDPLGDWAGLRQPDRLLDELLEAAAPRNRPVAFVTPCGEDNSAALRFRRGRALEGGLLHDATAGSELSGDNFRSTGAGFVWTDTLLELWNERSPRAAGLDLTEGSRRARDGSLWLNPAVWHRCPQQPSDAWHNLCDDGLLLRTVLTRRAGAVREGHSGDVYVSDSRNCIVQSQDHLVAAIGCEGLHVVATRDATLILPRNATPDMLVGLTEALEEADRVELFEPPSKAHEWGRECRVAQDRGWTVHLVYQEPGTVLRRGCSEDTVIHWTVLAGEAYAKFENTGMTLRPGTALTLPPSGVRRCDAGEGDTLIILETRRQLGKPEVAAPLTEDADAVAVA